ncbi:hypothetical protein J3R83DRAFT_2415 [Lanmaoa asiatica]|nr:hypothetical protein J3R83DRAFT_2415 [Lanmaoa asiatica]
MSPSETRVAPTLSLLGSPMQGQEGWRFPSGSSWHSYHSSLQIPTCPCLDPHSLDASPHSTPVNQVKLDLVGVEYNSSAFLESGLSFESESSDYAFTSLDPTQAGLAWTSLGPEYGSGPVFTEDPAVNNNLQISDGISQYLTSSIFALPVSCTTNSNFQTSSLGQDTEANTQITNPYVFPPADILPSDWGSTPPGTHFFVESPSTLNSANPAAGVYALPYPGEGSQAVDHNAAQSPAYTATPPFEQQSTPFEGSVYCCQWKDGDGTICEEVITHGSLPGHLSKHGIKNMPRDRDTNCNWVGCRRKKPINRESIVRHIREVHLRVKRSPKQVQHPYL